MANVTIRVNGLSESSIKDAAESLRHYADWVKRKEEELIRRLAELGKDVASVRFTGATYDGDNDVIVRVEPTVDGMAIYAEGRAVAFIEFGSGAAMGYGHPYADEHGLGPGTWSDNPDVGGKGHWKDEDGWYYKHGEKSRGNPPAMAMVAARDAMVEELVQIAREVFAS